ncbi:MAG: amidase [Rhizobiaceae bacterium]
MNPAELSIAEAGTRLRDGSLTSVRLVQACLDRIAERDRTYNAFVALDAERALEAAANADQALQNGENKSPLYGIPIAIKDLIDTVGIRTAYGSRVFESHIPDKDAEIVRRLKAAGAIIVGKLDTYEFGMVGPSFDRPFPPAANPWRPDHFTGGSSSGSAAAVAGGLVRTTISSDTGGSIRGPASYCGVVGLKPTYVALPKDGACPLAPSLDHLGPVSATVAEAALTFDAVAGSPSSQTASSKLGQPLEGLRIGYARNWFARDPEIMPAIITLIDDAASQLSLLGARIEEIELPEAKLFEACGGVIVHAESYALHREQMAAKGHLYSEKTFPYFMAGIVLGEEDLALALRAAKRLREEVDSALSRCDVLLTVTTCTTALPFSDFQGRTARWTPMRTMAFNVTGHPALSVPCGFVDGLPAGLQVVGRHGDEATICQIGHAFEQATDVGTMKPTWRVHSPA